MSCPDFGPFVFIVLHTWLGLILNLDPDPDAPNHSLAGRESERLISTQAFVDSRQ